MTDSLITLPEPTAATGQGDPVPETGALRAHIERILRKLASAKPTPMVR
ncbi:hypothetical protein [Methylobacterium sp. P1-11]|nr:hypothetical protein [Methylobacterium sp. P1-11]